MKGNLCACVSMHLRHMLLDWVFVDCKMNHTATKKSNKLSTKIYWLSSGFKPDTIHLRTLFVLETYLNIQPKLIWFNSCDIFNGSNWQLTIEQVWSGIYILSHCKARTPIEPIRKFVKSHNKNELLLANSKLSLKPCLFKTDNFGFRLTCDIV